MNSVIVAQFHFPLQPKSQMVLLGQEHYLITYINASANQHSNTLIQSSYPLFINKPTQSGIHQQHARRQGNSDTSTPNPTINKIQQLINESKTPTQNNRQEIGASMSIRFGTKSIKALISACQILWLLELTTSTQSQFSGWNGHHLFSDFYSITGLSKDSNNSRSVQNSRKIGCLAPEEQSKFQNGELLHLYRLSAT